MKLKRFVTILAITAVYLLFSAQALAMQTEALFEPAQLSAAGTVTLNLTLTNDGSSKMSDISVSGPGVDYSTGALTIQAGESIHLPLSGITITDEAIGVPLTYIITYKQDNEVKHKEFTLTVIRGNVPGIEVKFEASRTSATKGTAIELKYTIRNTGTAQLQSITLKDRKIAGSTLLAKDLTLLPGEEYIVLHSFTMNEKSVISQPAVTYKVADKKEEKTYTGTQTMLYFINSKLDVAVEQGEAGPEGTVFTIKLANDGNQTIKNIQIKDELGNKVNDETFTLKVGSKNTLTYLIQPENVREVRFTITGKDATGSAYSDKTDTFVTRPYIDPSLIGLSFSAKVSELLDKTTGKMTVVFTLNNSSSVSMKHMVLSEVGLGQLTTMDEVDTGEHVYEQVIRLNEPRDLMFELTLEDSAGNPYKYSANITAAYFDFTSQLSSTPKPIASVDPEGIKSNSAALSKTLATLLIVLSALSAITALALIMTAAVDRRKAEIKRRARYESMRSSTENQVKQRASAVKPKSGVNQSQLLYNEELKIPSVKKGYDRPEPGKQQMYHAKPYDASMPYIKPYKSVTEPKSERRSDTKKPPDFMLKKDNAEGNVYPPGRQVRRVTQPKNEGKK